MIDGYNNGQDVDDKRFNNNEKTFPKLPFRLLKKKFLVSSVFQSIRMPFLKGGVANLNWSAEGRLNGLHTRLTGAADYLEQPLLVVVVSLKSKQLYLR